MPFNLGFGEVLVILIVALLVFGGRLPEVGRSLGRGLVAFKEGLKGIPGPEEDDDSVEAEEANADREEDSVAAEEPPSEAPEPREAAPDS